MAGKLLKHQVADARQGIQIRYPDGWTGEKVGQAVRVTSEDSSTGIGIVSKGVPGDFDKVFREAVAGIKGSLEKGKAKVSQQRLPIAGLPAQQAVVTGADKSGSERSALVAVARGKGRNYVITVIAPAGGGQIGIANLILLRGLSLIG